MLTTKAGKPELIATEPFYYQIALDGTITWAPLQTLGLSGVR